MTEIKGRWALTRDPAATVTPNGTAVANCGAADNILVNKATGEKVAVFYEIVAWKELSEVLASFKKGDVVEVEGLLFPKYWTDKQGHQRITLQVTLSSISKYEKSGNSASKPATSSTNSTASTTSNSKPDETKPEQHTNSFVDIPDDDELPF